MSRDNVQLFGRDICVGNQQELLHRLKAVVARGGHSLFFCNVHMLMLSLEDRELGLAMDDADLIMPDGVPLVWMQRRMGHPEAQVLRGYEALESVCAEAAGAGKPIGFLGSTRAVLDSLKANLSLRNPGLQISFSYAPPEFTSEAKVSSDLVETINSHSLFCLFVGLGCPKQEKWIHAYAPRLNCSLLGVGAAFDWLAGTTSKPPGWMEKSGLGWLFRLWQDPKRMWRRYLIYNTKFVLKSVVLLTRNLLRKNGDSPERLE